MFALHLSPHC